MPHTAPDTAYSAPPSTTDSLDAAPTPAGALFATYASRALVGRLTGAAVLVALDGLVWSYDLVETWNHTETFAGVSVASPGWGHLPRPDRLDHAEPSARCSCASTQGAPEAYLPA